MFYKKPIGDVFKIEVGGENDNHLQLVGGKDPDQGVREGRIVAIGPRETWLAIGYATYAFDKSLVNDEVLDKAFAIYNAMVGKRVGWAERNESGTVHTEPDGKTYVTIKCTAVDGVEEN